MSRTRKGSDIYRVNQEAGRSWVKVSADTFYVIETALRFAELTGGLFDPHCDSWWSCGESVQRTQMPDQEAIDRAKALIDYRNVELDQAGRRVRLTQPGMGLDLGAIGKGYAADSVASFCESGV